MRNWDSLNNLLLLRSLLAIDSHALNLLLLEFLGVGLLERDNTVVVQTRLYLNDGKVAGGARRYLLRREACHPWVNPTGKLLRLRVFSLELERSIAVESEHLGRGDAVALREDNKLDVLIGVTRLLVPLDLDGVRSDVVQVEVADTENGGEHRTGERGATGSGLILVESG